LIFVQRAGRVIAAAVAVVGYGHAFAAHPLATEDAETLGAGKFELELGAVGEPSAGSFVRSEGGVQLAWGVLADLDLRVRPVWLKDSSTGAMGTETERGLGDTTLSFKWRFLRGEVWSFALTGGAQLPTGDASKGLGKGFVAWQGAAIASVDLGAWHFDGNIGYEQGIDEELQLRHLVNSQLAARWSPSGVVQLVSEVGVERNPDRTDGTWPAAGRLGVIVAGTDWLDVDAGYQVGFNHAAPGGLILAGATIRW